MMHLIYVYIILIDLSRLAYYYRMLKLAESAELAVVIKSDLCPSVFISFGIEFQDVNPIYVLSMPIKYLLIPEEHFKRR